MRRRRMAIVDISKNCKLLTSRTQAFSTLSAGINVVKTKISHNISGEKYLSIYPAQFPMFCSPSIMSFKLKLVPSHTRSLRSDLCTVFCPGVQTRSKFALFSHPTSLWKNNNLITGVSKNDR